MTENPTTPASSTDAVTSAASSDTLVALQNDIRQQLDSPHCDEKAAKQIRKRWQSLQSATASDTEFASLHSAIDAQLIQLRDKLHGEIEQRETAFQAVVDMTDKLESDLENGHFSDASAAYEEIGKKLAAIGGLSSRRKDTIEKRLQAAQPQLAELSGWRRWGTAQAREQLIATMEGLAGSNQHPKVIAQEVNKARETWKGWDKSGEPTDKSLWERFDSACTTAYEPCKKYFEKQAAERKQNLHNRQALVDKLKTIFSETDWETPDWRRLDKLVRDSEQQWKRMGPVDGRHRKPLEEAFKAVINAFSAPLATERKRNLKTRRALIDDVTSAFQDGDTRRAIDVAKKAQQDWKPTVLSSPKQERELWREFRGACDAVFKQRDSERKAKDVQFADRVKQRGEVCAQLEQLASKFSATPSDVATGEMKKEFNKLKQTFENLDPVPYKLAAATDKRFRVACLALDEHLAKQRFADGEMKLDRDATCAAICETLEACVIDGDDHEQWRNALQNALAEWQAATAAQPQSDTPLEARFQVACGAVDDAEARQSLRDAVSAQLERRHDICLRLEVVAEIDSPAAFAKQRMALQVNRLAAAMGGRQSKRAQTTEPQAQNPSALRYEYWATTTVESGQRDELNQRFSRVHQALIKQERARLERETEKLRQAAERKAQQNDSQKPRPKRGKVKPSQRGKPHGREPRGSPR